MLVFFIGYWYYIDGDVMQIIGIICEYNPFHYGHLYQINKIKERYPDSIIISVVSSCFLQSRTTSKPTL